MKPLRSLIISGLLWPALALAQPYGGSQRYGGPLSGFGREPTRSNIQDISQLIVVLRGLIGLVQLLLGIFTVVMILVGAFHFIRGNAESGRKALLWAFVGFIIVILAYAIIPITCTLLQATGPACRVDFF